MAQGGRVLGMAVVLAVPPIAERSPFRDAAAASCVGCHLPAFCATSGAQSQIGQASHTPYHAPQLCHPLAGKRDGYPHGAGPVSYTHLRAHETRHDLVCRLLLEKKK